MTPNAQTFRKALETIFSDARERGQEYVDVVSGELHAKIGGYPSSNHRMPTCCSVMRQHMKAADMELSAPPKGKGAELRIRYYL
ncbi:hypothetical protein NLX71_18245 [Paenibacillus sp. MZ04-78.2]|uniref:hypothetical protein n=1 Tax=Paenibacillus sp. MZ04-78.2 TaxID=2962034 RepID=UPI0020B6CDCE|nr:hypothetical protein [Paenibacillus sp. MZ04-78.2]MCP3775215.1 hypothetical protein [Paenibacillus sp. MZ04-78.2]